MHHIPVLVTALSSRYWGFWENLRELFRQALSAIVEFLVSRQVLSPCDKGRLYDADDRVELVQSGNIGDSTRRKGIVMELRGLNKPTTRSYQA